MKEIRAQKLIKEAWIGQSSRYDTASQAAARLETGLNLVPHAIEAPLKDKMTEAHENIRRIGRQVDRLESHTFAVRKLVKQYKNLVHSTDHRIKELGDVQNWAEMLDQDLRVLERVAALREGS